MRTIGDGPHNFEPRSSNEDDTRARNYSPNFHTIPMSVLVPLKTHRVDRLMHVKSTRDQTHESIAVTTWLLPPPRQLIELVIQSNTFFRIYSFLKARIEDCTKKY
ncbi:hypothetical protein TNCV_98001 [Trichonephila clavipes]|nr:hypothetical protein TNCV_98001 [Trichonephila clavipes]